MITLTRLVGTEVDPHCDRNDDRTADDERGLYLWRHASSLARGSGWFNGDGSDALRRGRGRTLLLAD